MRRMFKMIFRCTNYAAFVVAGLLLLCGGCASRFFYYPDHNTYRQPSQIHPPAEVVTFSSADGTKLSGWFVPAIGPAKGTVLHFHGNAQNLTAHFAFVAWLPAEGFNVFTFDYRGYGASEGHAERRGLYEDSLAALNYIATRPGIDTNRLCVFGQSLGGAQALAVLGDHPLPGIRAIAIESTFYSYRTITRDAMAKMPLINLLRWPLSFLVIGNGSSPVDELRKLPPVPLVLVHGTADSVIPYYHSQWLFEEAKQPKQLWTVQGGEHTGAFINPNSHFRKMLVDFFSTAMVR